MAAKITVRELVTKLTIGGNATDKLARFGLAMNGVKAGLGIMVGAMKLASRATLGLVDDVTKMGDSIAKTSEQIGISAKAYQRLSFAAERSGASMRGLRKGLQNISKNLRDAEIAAGKGKGTGFTKALDDIGLSFKDLKGIGPEKQLGIIGEALAKTADKGERLAQAQKLLGERSGPNLAVLLAEGTAGIKALGDEAERLGLVMSDKAVKASAAFQDRMVDLQATLTGIKTTIGVALIPIVEKAVVKFTEWLLLNREFITGKFENGVKFLTNAFAGLMDNLDDIVKAFGDLADLSSDVLDFFRELSESVGGLENLVRILTAAWVTYRIAAIAATTGLALGPLGLLAVGLLVVAAAFSDVETEADRARKARDRFNAGLKEEKPIDKAQASRDAKAIAKAAREGKELSPELKARLVSQNSRQTQISIDAARSSIRSGIKSQAERLAVGNRRVVGGKFGTTRRGGFRSEKLLQNAGAGQLGLLKEIELGISDLRGDAKAAREAGPEQSDLDFVNSLIVPGVSGGGGGRRGRRGVGAKADEPADKSFEELMAEAIRSGQLPEAAALLTSTQPPIIITNTNNIITVEVDATSVFEGVPGENATEFSDRAVEFLEEFWGRKMRDGMDQLKPQLAR